LHLSIVFIVPLIGVENPPDNPSGVNATRSSATGDNNKEVCYENFTEAQLNVLLPVRLELCVVLFCIPFLICSFCYINFIRILSKLQHIDRRRRLRAIGMALGTLLVFALCFGPYNVSHIVGFITWKSPDWRDKALLCSTFNACLDPLIFYFSSSAVRGNVGSVMEGVKSRLNRCMSCHARCSSWGGINKTAQDKEHKQEEINAI
ncbi:free fatty acid receptor 2-like, partial [Seriola lalandi dorsalis]